MREIKYLKKVEKVLDLYRLFVVYLGIRDEKRNEKN
jgi:hypothetical protein|tara:strand:- start:517 stop:624 length:108 start_codon:yes stop_codon:yes gene_type:complete